MRDRTAGGNPGSGCQSRSGPRSVFHRSAANPVEGAALAVSLAKRTLFSAHEGNLSTSIILRAVLNKEHGIRAQALLSHIAVVELPGPRLALLTDAAMNIRPELPDKVQILNNAIDFAWSIGLGKPGGRLGSGGDGRTPDAETLDAAALSQMGKQVSS